MATTRLGVGDKEALTREVSQLLGRIGEGIPCPIPHDQLPRMHNHLVPQHLRDIVVTMSEAQYDTSQWFQGHAKYVVMLDGQPFRLYYEVSCYLDSRRGKEALCKTLMQLPATGSTVKIDGDKIDVVPVPLIHAAFGEHAAPLLEWVKNYGRLHAEMVDAMSTASKIIEMTSTAGQIRRMVPDMLQYLTKERRQAMEEQKRASSVPYEWAAFDRSCVARMLQAMAKSHLLPGSRRMLSDTPAIYSLLVELDI